MDSYIRIPAKILIIECKYAIRQIGKKQRLQMSSFCAKKADQWNRLRKRFFLSPKWDKDKVCKYFYEGWKENSLDFKELVGYRVVRWGLEGQLETINKLLRLATQANAISSLKKDENYDGVYVSGDDLRVLREWASSNPSSSTQPEQR